MAATTQDPSSLDPATMRCGHPDCDRTLTVEAEDIVETEAWKNGMGRGCAIEEVRQRCGWVGDGWDLFCPEHEDWGGDGIHSPRTIEVG